MPDESQDITVAGVEKSITDMVGRETESVDVSSHKFCREFDDAVRKVGLRDSQHVDEAGAGGRRRHGGGHHRDEYGEPV